MKPYGVKKRDKGCCPGHDKYSGGYKCESRKKLRNRLRPAKKAARQIGRLLLRYVGL